MSWSHLPNNVATAIFYATHAVVAAALLQLQQNHVGTVLFFGWLAFLVFNVFDTCRLWSAYVKDLPTRYDQKCGSFKRRPKLPDGEVKEERASFRRGTVPSGDPFQDVKGAVSEDCRMLPTRMSLMDFLWVKTFLGIPMYLQAVFGGTYQGGAVPTLIRKYYRRATVEQPEKMPDPEKAFAALVLGSSLAINFERVDESDGKAVGHYRVPKLHKVFEGQVTCAELSAEVDLLKAELIHVRYNGQDIAAADAVLLLVLHVALWLHPQVHGFANWGVNPGNRNDMFLHRCGLFTTYYNMAGRWGLSESAEWFSKMGWFVHNNKDTFNDIIGNAEKNLPQVHQFCKMTTLAKYSTYVKYIIATRTAFMREFEKMRVEDMKRNPFERILSGIDGEAFFLGSVLHSADHHSACQLDPLSLKCVDPSFAGVQEASSVIVSSIADQNLLLHVFYDFRGRSCGLPLFRETYAAGCKIDQEMADTMECCLIR